jgi:hypothetical protein
MSKGMSVCTQSGMPLSKGRRREEIRDGDEDDEEMHRIERVMSSRRIALPSSK